MLIQHDAQVRTFEQLGEQMLSDLDWLAPQILAVALEQVERVMDGTGKRAVGGELAQRRPVRSHRKR
jgi:hypothetical protein